MKVFYANVDGLLNKRDELLQYVNDTQPDVVLICEVIPKALKHPLSRSELALPGFKQPYLNFDTDEVNLGSKGIEVWQLMFVKV